MNQSEANIFYIVCPDTLLICLATSTMDSCDILKMASLEKRLPYNKINHSHFIFKEKVSLLSIIIMDYFKLEFVEVWCIFMPVVTQVRPVKTFLIFND